MRILIWNVRGLGKLARRRQVRDYIFQEKVDIVGLQETVKEDFSTGLLQEISGGLTFSWSWLPARGKFGGILLGIKVDSLEMETCSLGEFCIQMTVRDRVSNFRWEMICVYGPAQHDKSALFVEELNSICQNCLLPMVIGGDFNLIREASDKSSPNCDQALMYLFNNFIGDNQLREIKRSGPKFSWTNK